MKVYQQINEKERMEIYKLYRKNVSARNIAKELKRAPSTISRELRRNRNNEISDYIPDGAHKMAQLRKHKQITKMKKHSKLYDYVLAKLRDKWSPDTIAGRIKKETELPCISTETIYQFLYSKESNAQGLFHLLAKKRPARNKRGFRKPHQKGRIKDQVSVHERSNAANIRSEVGHFEGDLTFGRKDASANILVLTERKTRYTFLKKNDSKNALNTAKNIFNTLSFLPKNMLKSITFDNGKEFAKHAFIRDFLAMDTYFCDPHSPWQKGQVEKTNAMLHRYFNKNESVRPISEKTLENIQIRFNNMPRRILNFQTPAEAFFELLHNVALQT